MSELIQYSPLKYFYAVHFLYHSYLSMFRIASVDIEDTFLCATAFSLSALSAVQNIKQISTTDQCIGLHLLKSITLVAMQSIVTPFKKEKNTCRHTSTQSKVNILIKQNFNIALYFSPN